MPKKVRISLATKCQLLFGAAVVLILTAALGVGGVRMQTLVREGQLETCRALAGGWLTARARGTTGEQKPDGSTVVTLVENDEWAAAAESDPFLAEAVRVFRAGSERGEISRFLKDASGRWTYRYARAVRRSEVVSEGGTGARVVEGPADSIDAVMLIDLRSDMTRRQIILNRVYLVAAGLFAGLLAIGVFWFITTRIILSPVRVLRDTAAKISEGDINIRSDINTGDEFEQLSDMFNTMLENLKRNEDQLRGINKSLDLKLGELAETNVSLYEANKIKGEFLANVSHELRTPLNSIIGFAEVLGEGLPKSADPIDEKRRRYVGNIIKSSRQLLELINDLLDLAKIEAGRMELRVGSMSVEDTAEGLINLIRPQAEKRDIGLRLKVEPGIPLVQTDAGKFQQILFNFLSNAVKFTPPGGTITLWAKLLGASEGGGAIGSGEEEPRHLTVSVIDTGPGIPFDQHDHVFEKFTQLDSTETREHGGTGLGLKISKDLAVLLQGRIELESDEGRGATFSLIIPLSLESKSVPLMPDLVDVADAKEGSG